MPNLELPDGFPPIVIRHCDAARREPGYIVVSLGKSIRAISRSSEFEALIALDQNGDVAWYWQSGVSLMDVKLTSKGTLLVLTTDGCIQEINFIGKVLRKWSTPGRNPTNIKGSISVNTPYFHHAVQELPNGNIAALSITSRDFNDYPLNQENPNGEKGPRRLVGDTLVEFQPDGEIVNEFDFFEILDPYRFGYGLDGPFWSLVDVVPRGADWSHANGLFYDRSDDSFIITVRHQDCAIKIDRHTGKLNWILGTPEGWSEHWQEKLLTPTHDIKWHWHPHDPSVTADGSIMLFDNGASGAIPPTPRPDINTCFSRAVAYNVDESAMTVEQVWSFGGEGSQLPYSMYVSGATELTATGNIFVTFGGITLTKDKKKRTDLPPLGQGSVELFEVTRDNNPEILFHAEINNRDTEECDGWAAFRAEWIPEGALSS